MITLQQIKISLQSILLKIKYLSDKLEKVEAVSHRHNLSNDQKLIVGSNEVKISANINGQFAYIQGGMYKVLHRNAPPPNGLVTLKIAGETFTERDTWSDFISGRYIGYDGVLGLDEDYAWPDNVPQYTVQWDNDSCTIYIAGKSFSNEDMVELSYKSFTHIISEDVRNSVIGVNNGCHYGSIAVGRSVAQNYNACAFGGSQALGDRSFAVGNSCASGIDAFSSGAAVASGNESCAENRGNAQGYSSHAEGYNTFAKSRQSHAEGCGTIADGANECVHAQGIYNIDQGTEGTLIHIVGNGTYSDRSNAHTLDFDGTAWFQGDVYTGSTSGTNKDEGSKKLATEEYVTAARKELILLSSTEGSTKQFKITVDDSGSITAAEITA